MAKTDLFEIEGFDELNTQLKKLDDSVKRTEVLKILRRSVQSLVLAYRETLPVGKRNHGRYVNAVSGRAKKGKKSSKQKADTYTPGNLSRSVRAKTVGAKKTGGNPAVQILPDKTTTGGEKNDGYYRFMVVKKGFTGKGRGSRVGSNTVVKEARDKAVAAVAPAAVAEANKITAKYVQTMINRLSNK